MSIRAAAAERKRMWETSFRRRAPRRLRGPPSKASTYSRPRPPRLSKRHSVYIVLIHNLPWYTCTEYLKKACLRLRDSVPWLPLAAGDELCVHHEHRSVGRGLQLSLPPLTRHFVNEVDFNGCSRSRGQCNARGANEPALFSQQSSKE